MNNRNTGQQLRYLEEISISLHRVGFETKSLEDCERSILWNNAPLCRITGRGSVFYRREDVDTPQAEDALFRVEDIAAKTLEYMTTMESAPQLKASGLDGDYRILADFGGTVLAGTPSKHAFNSSHGIGITATQACPTGTTLWRTTMAPSRTSPRAQGLSKRNSFSVQSS